MRVIRAAIAASKTKLKAFVDTFNRADNGSTLEAVGTKKWVNLRGTWGVSSNKANTATAASSYPLATVKMGTKNARLSATTGTSTHIGVGVAFWVTDANNFYGAYTDRTYYQAGPFSYQYCPGGYPYENCPPLCSSGANISGLDPGHACAGCGCGGANFIPYQGGPGQCPGGWSNTGGDCCQCGSTTSKLTGSYYTDNYVYYVRVMQMASNVATVLDTRTVTTTGSNANNMTYLQVETNTPTGNSIRTTTQIDAGSASQGTVALTTPVQASTHGIMLAPRSTGTNQPTQAANIDQFEYTPL